MIFGIWPGAVAADLVTLQPVDCPPEQPQQTLQALKSLQGESERFFIRSYRHFGRGAVDHAGGVATPVDPGRYVGGGRQIDLVACYQSPTPDAAGFAEFVRRAVRDVGGWGGGKVQIGEELNVSAPQDGGSPGCFDAISAGVQAGLEERDRLGAPVAIGVNSAGLADPGFWQTLAAAVGRDHIRQLDYIGLDAFPDVFRPISWAQLPAAVDFLLTTFRRVTAGVGVPEDTPIHITETGWPTDEERDEATQSRTLVAVAEAIRRSSSGVTAYEFFGLRDGLTAGSWHNRFGLLHDDYTPKPAFHAICDLIAADLPR